MAIAEDILGNQQDKGSHVIEAPEAAATAATSHGNDVYELYALDMAQHDAQRPRSKLRLIAILIALDVSSNCIAVISLIVDFRLILYVLTAIAFRCCS